MEAESPLAQLGCDYCPLSAFSHHTHTHTHLRAHVKRQTERRVVGKQDWWVWLLWSASFASSQGCCCCCCCARASMMSTFKKKKKKSLKHLRADICSSVASSGRRWWEWRWGGVRAPSSHARGRRQLVEEDVGVAAADLTGGHWRYSGSRERESEGGRRERS